MTKQPEPEYIVKWRSLCWIAFWAAMAIYGIFTHMPFISLEFKP